MWTLQLSNTKCNRCYSNKCSTVYRGVLISGGWNRKIPLYTEVFSFQGVGIERFHCIVLTLAIKHDTEIKEYIIHWIKLLLK